MFNLRTESLSLSKLSVNSHPLPSLSFSHIVICVLPCLPFLCFPKCPLHPPVFYLSQFLCLLSLPYLLSIFFTRSPLHPTLFILSPSLLLSRSSCHSCHSALSLDDLSSPLLIDLEWRVAEKMGAVLLGRSICTDMEHQLIATE